MSLKALAIAFSTLTLVAGAAQAGGSSTPNTPPGHQMHQHDNNNGNGKKVGHVKHHGTAYTGSYARRVAAGYRR